MGVWEGSDVIDKEDEGRKYSSSPDKTISSNINMQ